MKRRKKDMEETEEVEEIEELSEKELKKRKQKESVEKRKSAKKKDKVARWGGIIILGLVMFIGFLLWVSGEIREDIKPLNQGNIEPFETQRGSIIVR